jgi:SRSO17 transposase
LSEPHPQEWLLIEWPDGETEPTKYWLSTVPADTPMTDLVAAAKGRWRIERDYRELKQEVGLGHFEGRGWRGFHHHASLCIAAYGFLVTERCLFPPEQRFQTQQRAALAIPAGARPRGTRPS